MNELELLSFENMGLSAQLLQNIQTLKFKKPTYIQSKLIPLILEGKDVVCCSKTGSGKTAAYMIPLINKLKNHSEVIGSRALILVHSRELALQTARNLRELIHGMDLRYSIIIGGHDYEGQFDSLATNPDIIIATPGRIMEILQETQFSLVKVEYLIIDEADGLFEKGFAPQIKEILKKVSQRRHTILLSATIPEDVSRFASSGLRDYALVKVDSEYKLPDKAVMHNFLCRPEQKVSLLIYTLQNIIAEGERSIIFVSSRQWGDYLDNLLPAFNLTSVNINGKMGQEDRFEKMGMFNRKDAMNLIVTDLGARGLDLPFVRNVINFDFPQSTKLFIHRCGRTARADRTGTIYSFFTPSERLYFGELKSKIERTFETVKQSGVYNYNHIYYGKAPENIIFSGMECISRALKEDTELFNLHVAASNSMEKFEKSRAKVNSAGKKQMDGFDWEAYHPLFEGLVDKSANEFVAKMKQYKPKVSHFGYERAKQQANSDIIKLGSVLQRKCNDHKARAVYKRKMKTDADDENAPMNAEEEYRMHEEEIEADLLKIKEKFKSNKLYISNGTSGEPNELTKDVNPDSEIRNLVMEQNAEHLYEHRKFIWDDSKKAFKKKKIGLDGEVVNEDHKTISKDKLRVQKMQDRYKTWKKQSPLNFQKVGDRETMSNTNKAVASFKNRMHKKQTSDAIKRKKDVTRRVSESKGNSGFMKGRKVVSELKSASQIAKNKAFKKQKSFGSGRGGRGGSRGGRGGSSRGGSVARGGGKKLGGRH